MFPFSSVSLINSNQPYLSLLLGKDIYKVFHRMPFYNHYDIGFVARSTIDRRGKFKQASNFLCEAQRHRKNNGEVSMAEAHMQEGAHNDNGSRFVMYGNDVIIGDLIVGFIKIST
jgi:hypothetical protein